MYGFGYLCPRNTCLCIKDSRRLWWQPINRVDDDADDEIGNDDSTLAVSGAGANDGRLVEPKVPCHRAENCHPPTPTSNPQPTSPPKQSSLLRHNYSATGVLTGCALGSSGVHWSAFQKVFMAIVQKQSSELEQWYQSFVPLHTLLALFSLLFHRSSQKITLFKSFDFAFLTRAFLWDLFHLKLLHFF